MAKAAKEKVEKVKPKVQTTADMVRARVNESLKERMEEHGDPLFVSFNSQIEIKRKHTGSLALDELFGGGIPEGRLIQMFGMESSGKTSISLAIAGQFIKDGHYPIGYIDAENAIDPAMAKSTFGVDLFDEEKVIFSQQDDAEMIYEMLGAMADGGVPLAIVDSTDAMLTEAEDEGGFADAHVSQIARRHSLGLKKLKRKLRKSGMILIFISQVRQKIEIGGAPRRGSNETTSGGNAIKFYCSIRARTARVEYIPASGAPPRGMKISIKTHKNKTAKPFRTVELTYMYDKGIVSELDSLRVAAQYGAVGHNGSMYTIGDQKFKGAQAASEYLLANPAVWVQVRDATLKAMQSNSGIELKAGATELELDEESGEEKIVASPSETTEDMPEPVAAKPRRQPKADPTVVEPTPAPVSVVEEPVEAVAEEPAAPAAEEPKEMSAYMRRKLKKEAEAKAAAKKKKSAK